MNENEGIFSRWSRRKQQSVNENEREDQALRALQEAEAVTSDSAQNATDAALDSSAVETVEPVLTDADMPDIDTLTADSDYSGFMSPGVSDELRNLALRKLFRAAVFNERDGLDEYDDDYTSFEKLGDIVTCDMKHQMEIEARKRLEQEQAGIMDEADLEPVEDFVEGDEDFDEPDEGAFETLETSSQNSQDVSPAQSSPEQLPSAADASAQQHSPDAGEQPNAINSHTLSQQHANP